MASPKTIKARQQVLISARLLAHQLRASLPIGPTLERLTVDCTELDIAEGLDAVLERWQSTTYAP